MTLTLTLPDDCRPSAGALTKRDLLELEINLVKRTVEMK